MRASAQDCQRARARANSIELVRGVYVCLFAGAPHHTDTIGERSSERWSGGGGGGGDGVGYTCSQLCFDTKFLSEFMLVHVCVRVRASRVRLRGLFQVHREHACGGSRLAGASEQACVRERVRASTSTFTWPDNFAVGLVCVFDILVCCSV